MLWRQTLVLGPFGSNCTLLGDRARREAVVIDPGDDAPAILLRLAREQLRVVALLHTHGHIDHVGATAELRRVTGAPVYLHDADRPLFDGAAEQAALFGLPPPPACPVDRPLADGERVAVGDLTLEVLHTPGHSPGSVSLWCANERLCIVGDTLFAGGVGRTDLFGGDFAALERSIRERLYTLPDETVIVPGHGPDTTIGDERQHNPFVRG